MTDLCYTYIETERIIGIIHRNETGYYKTDTTTQSCWR